MRFQSQVPETFKLMAADSPRRHSSLVRALWSSLRVPRSPRTVRRVLRRIKRYTLTLKSGTSDQ